jgi:predicted phosphodiesterase
MSSIKSKKLQETIDYYLAHGEEATCDHFGFNRETMARYLRKARLIGLEAHDTCDHFGFNRETMARYLRKARLIGLEAHDTNKTLRRIKETFTDDELTAIANGGRLMPGVANVPIINFDGKRIRVGHMTDTHIGSKYCARERIFQAFEEFKKEGVDMITHSGDVSEGMNNRPGHIYELSHIGYAEQKKECINVFGQWSDTDVYAISGNHDQWFIKSNGANIIEDIDSALDNFHFIGHDEGDISLSGQATMKLWHGGDGNSYALSYRLQKILESLSGGEKPNILVAGHTHKYVKIFERNVWTISVGTLCRQTPWMRGKRIAAHVGFVIADYWLNKDGVSKMRETWYPFYT